MSLFFAKNSDGTVGFYDDSINPSIPTGAVEITPEEHQTLLAGQSVGKLIQADANGNPVLVDPPAPSLASVQASALLQADADAEKLRSIFITATPGQVATYMMKYNDASSFKAAGYPSGSVPGLVQAEADATGAAAKDAADAIIAQYTAWNTLAASIEKARREAKIAISAATTTAAVATALSNVEAQYAAIKQAAGA